MKSTVASDSLQEGSASAERSAALTPAERILGQRAALRANLLTMVSDSIVIGPLMMLFANDGLGLSPKRISAILAIIPVVGLTRVVLLETLRRLGKRRVIFYGDMVRLAVITALLLLLPYRAGFVLYTALLCCYVAGQQLGIGIAWQPLLRDITTEADRGRFFAGMRFWFQAVTAVTMTLLPLLLGDRIEPWQYKALLLVAAAGTFNHLYWVRLIPERFPQDDDTPRALFSPRLWRTLRHSRLLRLPLLIAALLLLVQAPIYVIYLRTMMRVPVNIVSVFHEDEDTRCRTARWFAAHPSPLSVDPLCELLSDPSYDVRVAAIRALAETGSDLAGRRLLAMFEDVSARYVASQTAWALGELRYRPAVDALCATLDDNERPELQAVAARALGKIGDEQAVEPLVARLRAKPVRRKVISSTSRALLRFNAAARTHAELLFAALGSLEEREDRYEIMDGLCGLLNISNEWLLRHLEKGAGARGALEAYAALKSDAWRAQHAALLTALREGRFEEIQARVKTAAESQNPVHQGLLAALAIQPPPLSVHIMAAAWLLLRKTNGSLKHRI